MLTFTWPVNLPVLYEMFVCKTFSSRWNFGYTPVGNLLKWTVYTTVFVAVEGLPLGDICSKEFGRNGSINQVYATKSALVKFYSVRCW